MKTNTIDDIPSTNPGGSRFTIEFVVNLLLKPSTVDRPQSTAEHSSDYLNQLSYSKL